MEQEKKRGRPSRAEMQAKAERASTAEPDPREDCFAEVKHPQAIVLFMQERPGQTWFTKNEEAAEVFEKHLREVKLGYAKLVDLSWGFQATFELRPESNPWVKTRRGGRIPKHYPEGV